ncbi:MAG: ROK family transcriptional regulator [Rhodobacteraceae bacterium]|nr:ROK family transcriptional regulator [Paracoccaceae bacterium]
MTTEAHEDSHAATPRAATPVRGSNQSGLRAFNERLVLTILRSSGPLPKAEIARMTGLSPQTVSVIMRALEADGLLVRGDPLRGRVGQPSVPMALAPDGALFFGLKIGRRSTDLVLTDFLGRVLGRQHRAYRFPTPDATLRFARAAMADLTAALPPAQRARIAGLGIAMPFRIWDWASHIGEAPSTMAAWRNLDIRAALAEGTGVPVYLQNDASSACGAELVFGTSDTPQTFLYFYVAYFIGGGLVLNGSLYTGQTGNAGALGSLPVPGPGGTVRQLIDVASLSGLEARLVAAGLPAEGLWESAENWALDPAIVADWTATAAAGIAHAIAAAVCVIDFDLVMIDGWIPPDLRAGLSQAVAAALGRINLAGITPPEVREGTIGADARALGAASLPLADRFLVDRNAFLKSA